MTGDSPLRIGIDYLPAVRHAPGVGRYARELVRALVRLPAAPTLHLFEVGAGPRPLAHADLGLEKARVRRFSRRVPRRLVRWLHKTSGVGADRLLGGVDLFHHIRPGELPISRAREMVPVPELPAPGDDLDAALTAAARRGSAALVFCNAYRSTVQERFGFPPERVYVVPVGCEHWRRQLPDAPPPSRTEPARILVLGAARRARHPALVLAAFEALAAGGLEAELLFVGRPGDAAAELEAALARSRAAARVRWIRTPVEADMPALVAGSSLLVHLADEEGTSVTPLEAFSFGAPVVASRLPAFEESLGKEATYVDTTAARDDPRTLAEACAAALRRVDDGAARRREIAARHTWQANAQGTLAAWRGILAQLERGGAH